MRLLVGLFLFPVLGGSLPFSSEAKTCFFPKACLPFFLGGLPTLFKKTKKLSLSPSGAFAFCRQAFFSEACRPLFSEAKPCFSRRLAFLFSLEACRPFIKRGEAPRVNERKRIFSFLFLFFLLTLLLILNLTLTLTLTLLLIFYPLYNLPLLLNGET